MKRRTVARDRCFAQSWLDRVTQMDLRTALLGTANIWLDAPRRRGFLRSTFNPLNPDAPGPETCSSQES